MRYILKFHNNDAFVSLSKYNVFFFFKKRVNDEMAEKRVRSNSVNVISRNCAYVYFVLTYSEFVSVTFFLLPFLFL